MYSSRSFNSLISLPPELKTSLAEEAQRAYGALVSHLQKKNTAFAKYLTQLDVMIAALNGGKLLPEALGLVSLD